MKMCVIAYKSKNVKFPSAENIRAMWGANPDGAGIMWRERGGIRWKKGFMKLDDFTGFVEANRRELEGAECALHFRITTHGGTTPGNCHPFAVAADADPHLLEGKARRVLMHNGILPVVPRRKDISDTAELALRLGAVANPAESMKAFDECLRGNRIILMDEGGTRFFGDGFRESSDPENSGILYSNLNFEFRGTFAGGPGLADYEFDWKSRRWRESFTGKTVDVWDVDPYSVRECDLDVYDECSEAENLGCSLDEFRELKGRAAEAGMDVYEYVDVCKDREDW